MATTLHLKLPIRCVHKNKGPGYLGLVAAVSGNKSRPLFMKEDDALNVLEGQIRQISHLMESMVFETYRHLVLIPP